MSQASDVIVRRKCCCKGLFYYNPLQQLITKLGNTENHTKQAISKNPRPMMIFWRSFTLLLLLISLSGIKAAPLQDTGDVAAGEDSNFESFIINCFCSYEEEEIAAIANCESASSNETPTKRKSSVLEIEIDQDAEEALSTHNASKLQRLKEKAYAALFAVFKETFSGYRYIKWAHVDVVGWPQDVLFYSSPYWSAEDCESLLKAVQRGQISFSPKSSLPNKASDHKQRLEQLKAKASKVSKVLFDSNQIEWKKIKKLYPALHLTRSLLNECNADDCRNLDVALRAIEAEYNLNFEAESNSDANVTFESLSIAQLKANVYAKLLEKYQEAISSSSRIIHWGAVEVKSWPQEVLYYHQSMWSEADCQCLIAAMPRIRFIDASSAENESIFSEDLVGLKERVKSFFWKYFKTRAFQWNLIKEHVPRFHLSSRFMSGWNWKDVKMMEEVFKYFEENDLRIMEE